uniref:Glutamic acid-rich protein-like n=1 Tax=Tanacetum cinerariifolium TaxID=118510 RepID=A0A6L2KHB5_TANCI|nr:hypothetical protein [Tanacetum cinerariifolium]
MTPSTSSGNDSSYSSDNDSQYVFSFGTLLQLSVQMTSLDDAEGVVCLLNEEIFAGLAQMGYEKPSTKLTFYKAFFSSQWKFLIHTLLQSLSAKRTSWNEFSSVMASVVICLSKGQKFNFSKYIFDSLETVAEDVANEAIPSTPTPLISPSPPSHDNLSTSQVQSLPPHHHRKLEIIKLKAKVKRLERANMVKSSKLRHLKKVGTSQRIESSDDMEDVFNQGRMIDDLDKDEGIELVVDQVKDADTAETEGRHAVE